MIVNIRNKSESALVIEYNGKPFRYAGNQCGQLEVDSSEFELSAYMDLIDTVDLELKEKSVKNKIFQKLFDKPFSLSEKFMVQCKNTYKIKLNSPYVSSFCLDFEFAVISKENTFVEQLFEMPIDVTSFARLECDFAEICVTNSEAINKKEFLKIYKLMYLWINWNMGLLSVILSYIPAYLKQKRMVSGKCLSGTFKKLYSVSREERNNLLTDKKQ